jgi:hypothetical protein
VAATEGNIYEVQTLEDIDGVLSKILHTQENYISLCDDEVAPVAAVKEDDSLDELPID